MWLTNTLGVCPCTSFTNASGSFFESCKRALVKIWKVSKYSVIECIHDIFFGKDQTVFCIYLPDTENQLLNRTEPLNASNGRPDTPLRPSPGSNPNKRAAPSARPSSPIPVSSNTSTTSPAIKKLGGADTELANNIGGSAEMAKKVSPASVSEMKANSVAKVQQSYDSCLVLFVQWIGNYWISWWSWCSSSKLFMLLWINYCQLGNNCLE